MIKRTQWLSATAMAGLAGVLLSAQAQAQVVAPTPNTTPTGGNTTPSGLQATTNPPDASQLEEVVVTGTRIARPNLQSNNPVAVIDQREIEVSGITDVADLLQRQPQVGIGANASNTTNTVRNQGIETISLRNLGTQRTLVLVNGHRQVGGAAGSSAVDVNTISTSLLDRVDVVTGGSSALYGADAVAGVVNFITRRDFEGVGFKAQYGDTEHGGGTTYYGSATVGHNFLDGRGNFTASAVYNQIDPIYRYQRDYALSELSGVPNPARSTNPAVPNAPAYYALTGVTSNVYGSLNSPLLGTYPALVTALKGAPGLTYTFDANGALTPLNRGTILKNNAGTAQTSSINCATCFYSYLDALQDAQQKEGVEVAGHFEFIRDQSIFKNVEAYVEGKYYRTDGRAQSNTGTFAGTSIAYNASGGSRGLPSSGAAYPIFTDNAYLPAALSTLIASTPKTGTGSVPVYPAASIALARTLIPGFGGTAASPQVIYLSRIDNDFGNRYSKTYYETGEVVAGIRGEFKNNWRFDAFFNHGETSSTGINYDRNQTKFYQQLDAVVNPANGQVVCRSSLTNPGNGCIPINLFVNGSNSQAAVNYSYGPTFDQDLITLTNAQVNLSGDLFHMPSLFSGSDLPIGFAAGYEYRRESSKTTPDILNRTGIAWGNVSAFTEGSYHTNEGYAELNVPVLADVPFAKRVEFDASARIQDYTTTGVDWTYGANGDWAITEDVKLRGVYAKAVRAPNINELFAAGSQSFNAIADPCDANNVHLGVQPANRLANCLALLGPLAGSAGNYTFLQSPATKSNYTTGNPNLNPEKSTTYTAGIVFTPRFIPNFAATIDYYDIKIKDAIASLSLASIVNDCVDSATLDNQFCTQVSRGADGNILNVNNATFNVAALKTRGVDFGMSYRLDIESLHLPRWGALTFNLNATYVNNLLYSPVAGDPTTRDQRAGELSADQPRFRGTGRVTYDFDAVTVSYAVEYIGGMNMSNQDKPLDYGYERVPEYASQDVKLEYRFTGREKYLPSLKGVSTYVGINNFTDEAPPFLPGVFTGTGTASIYGPIGRFYYVGLTGKF